MENRTLNFPESEYNNKDNNNGHNNIFTVILCVVLSTITACVSSVITVRVAIKKEMNNIPTYSETESSLFPDNQTNTLVAQDTTIPTTEVITTEAPATIVEATIPTTLPPTTVPTTEATTEETTNPSKSSVYSTAVHSVVGVSSYSIKYTRTLLGVRTSKEYSNGSGFFASENGYVITNAHVIENAESITVTDYEENTYEATVIAQMEDNDIAILKIDADAISVEFGDSSEVCVGDDCMVIGNPMGNLSYTYTDGIISYINREIATDSGYLINMYQTNCAINSGNSGGPVFNSKGKVIGIATAKYSTSEGLSFFIPINDVKDFINSNIE